MGVHKRRRWVGGLERRSLLLTPCQSPGALWVSLKRRLNGIERRLLVIFETPMGAHRRRESSKEPHLGVHDPHSCGVQEPSIHRWVSTNHPPSTGGCPRTATSTNHHRRQSCRPSGSIHTWVSTNLVGVHERKEGGCGVEGCCPCTAGFPALAKVLSGLSARSE
jgi:hypothetical protein